MTTPYTAGTVTLTNGSAVITGIGTAWQTALIAGGILIAEADGNPLPILSVDSNTQITAAIKWKGVSGTYPYAIMRDTAYGQQTVANAQALSNYLTRLDTATLSALNALGPSMIADRVPYATSNAAMAWAPFTAYGRTLVAVTSDTSFASAAKVVRRSGGANMTSTNDVMLGWHSTLGGLIGQVDAVYLGYVWNDYYATSMGGAADIRAKIGAFAIAGGTVQGSVTATGNVTATNGVIGRGAYVITPATDDGAIYFQTGAIGGATLTRWVLYKAGYGVGEPGSNVGGNLHLNRHADDGTYLGTPLIINRRYGTVETNQTPQVSCYPGTGSQAVAAGTFIGVLPDSGNFAFNRGGFYAGGNPGVGGRAMHVPIPGWYRVRASITSTGAGTVILCINGGGWASAYNFSNQWMTTTVQFLASMAAGDYFTLGVGFASMQISRENTNLHVEWIGS